MAHKQAYAVKTTASVQSAREKVLSRFIVICGAVLSAPNVNAGAAIIVNRIGEILPVDRAVLVALHHRQHIKAVTGGGIAAQDSSFADAISFARNRYQKENSPLLLPGVPKEQSDQSLAKIQQAMNGTHILWLPLRLNQDGTIETKYVLWLERWHAKKWHPAEIELLQHCALFVANSLLRPRSVPSKKRKVKYGIILLGLLLFIMMPTTTKVTAPARIVPDQPHYIFAPMDGILKELYVQPGQKVKQNELLCRYDDRVLDKRLDEAFRSVAVARAKLARLEGAAHRSAESRAELPVQRLEVKRCQADIKFFAKQKARADVRTSIAGVVVLDNPDALIGAALKTGQVVMSVADPAKTKIHINVPASDVGLLKIGGHLEINLDSAPFHSYDANIIRIGYEIRLSDEQIPSVLTEAVWTSPTPDIRPGQKGSVKIFGKSTLMGMQIFRKPMIMVRSMIGF